ncbi:MAG: sulfatase [Solirubrobacterales bacterium]|nr:sulfatase [Solirubrobacterales bacterium]
MAACLLTTVAIGTPTRSHVAQAAPRIESDRPNFLVIQTDDLAKDLFDGHWTNRRSHRRLVMPKTQKLVADAGIRFDNYLTPDPFCAPSRVSLLSGRYAHNHGVLKLDGSKGGWTGFRSQVVGQENLPVWLKRGGYRTSHFGKFINHYGESGSPETAVPPGWDRWFTQNTDGSNRAAYGYFLNVDGSTRGPIGAEDYRPWSRKDPPNCGAPSPQTCNYNTDVVADAAVQEIREHSQAPQYIQLDLQTPHVDNFKPRAPEPATKYYGAANRSHLPRSAGFDEKNVSDKPWGIRRLRPLNSSNRKILRREYRRSVEALQSVDDAVERAIAALRDTGKLDNTYVFFTSDEGYLRGQHRISRGKLYPYEQAINVPFVVRGPTIEPGTESRALVANQDFAPTVLDLAGATSQAPVDGQSMVSRWVTPSAVANRAILLSSNHYRKRNRRHFEGVRTNKYKFVRYGDGEKELYRESRDPAELRNLIDRHRYRRVRKRLSGKMRRLKRCSGPACG